MPEGTATAPDQRPIQVMNAEGYGSFKVIEERRAWEYMVTTDLKLTLERFR